MNQAGALRFLFRSAICFSIIWAVAGGTAVAESALWVAQEGSTVQVDGKSTLHPWTLKASRLELSVQVSGVDPSKPVTADALVAAKLSGLKVTIPVEGLKSTEGSAMDKNTWGALKSKEAPNITFAVEKAELTKIQGRDAVRAVSLAGVASIGGVERSVVIPAEVEVQGQRVILRGQTEITMTEYGIKPPVILIIKVADKVVVNFKVILGAGR